MLLEFLRRKSSLLLDTLRMAVSDLRSHPLRAGLTVAGFAFSIVISTVLFSSGKGLSTAVAGILRELGEGQLLAVPGRTTGLGGVRRSGRQVRLRYRDLEGIEASLPSFSGISSYFDLRGAGASSWKYSIPWSPIRAVAPGFRDVRQLPLLEGRWFTSEEERGGSWVAVLNAGLRRMIFRDHEAVGQWIEWQGRRLTVVGVVRDEALFPYILFIPYETVGHMADARYITGVIARPLPRADWASAEKELRRALAGLGGFDPEDENAVEVETNQEFTSRVRVLTAALRILVLTIAAVSLMLGGLGVANLMSIAVQERTREIGLRRALGASAAAIFAQIFLEAMLLIAAGAAAGIGGGKTACQALGRLPMTNTYEARIEFDAASTLICLAALAAVGVISAIVPARRAAGLVPMEALRWE